MSTIALMWCDAGPLCLDGWPTGEAATRDGVAVRCVSRVWVCVTRMAAPSGWFLSLQMPEFPMSRSGESTKKMYSEAESHRHARVPGGVQSTTCVRCEPERQRRWQGLMCVCVCLCGDDEAPGVLPSEPFLNNSLLLLMHEALISRTCRCGKWLVVCCLRV